MELVHHETNRWPARAGDILQERAAEKRIDPVPLAKMMHNESSELGKLQLVWACGRLTRRMAGCFWI